MALQVPQTALPANPSTLTLTELITILETTLETTSGETMALQIFEPRYRLMVRRVMTGSRRLGMAVRMRGAQDVETVVTEAEITELRPLPDGCVLCAAGALPAYG